MGAGISVVTLERREDGEIHSFGVQPLTPREGETGFTIVRAPQGGYLADTDGWGSSANSEFLREVSMASQRQQRQPETTTTDETGAASEAAPTPPDESPDSSVAIARSGPYGRAAGVPTRVTRFLAVTATPRPGQERPENPSPPRPRSRFPMMTRMYNYMRGRSSSSSSSSSSSRAAATTTTTSTTAPSQSRQLALPAASGDVHAAAEDSSNDSSSSSSSPLESHSTSGLRRRRNARASGNARSPGHALRDAVERVARELGVNVDRSTSGSSAASAAAWDETLEDGSPSPEALRARMSFLAETMTSVLREFDARLQRVAGAGAGGGTRMLGDGGKWPATREDVDALPTRTVSVSETELCRGCADGTGTDDDEQGPQCYICLGEYEAGETLRTLPCGHAFHAPCVDKWLLEQRRACPTCRATVPAVKKATPCVASSRAFGIGEAPRLALPAPPPRGFAAVPSEADPRVLLLPGVASH